MEYKIKYKIERASCPLEYGEKTSKKAHIVINACFFAESMKNRKLIFHPWWPVPILGNMLAIICSS